MEQREPIEAALVHLLLADERVSFAYLFGSRARGRDRPNSDVDVGLWLETAPETLGAAVLDVGVRLSEELGVTADVTDLNRAPLLLRARVVREGKLLVERDRRARVAFESLTLQERIDFEPIRRRCVSGMLRHLREEAAGG